MIVGVDVGISGAVAFLEADGSFGSVYDMPTMPSGRGKRQQVNPAALAQLLRERLDGVLGPHSVIVERVATMPRQGVASQGSLMCSFGIVQGVLAGLKLPCELVTPQMWKKAFSLGADKDVSRSVAQRLYPMAPLGRKKDHGRAESLLIARYGWQRNGGR